MTYTSIDFDQDQRLAAYEAIEDIYMEGVTDAANGKFPVMSEIAYLQGYAQGMKDYPRREVKLPVISNEVFEMPLLCGQCAHLVGGKCGVKRAERDRNRYACEQVLVDSPF